MLVNRSPAFYVTRRVHYCRKFIKKHYHHHLHVHEGLDVFPVPWFSCSLILKMKLVPPSLPRSFPCSFVLSVYIVALVLVFCLYPSSVRVVATYTRLIPRGHWDYCETWCLYMHKLHVKKKVKVTVVQALSLCTGCTAHRGSRGIALLFLDHCTRRGEGSASRPGRSLPRERTGTHCTGGCLGPRAGLDMCGKSRPPPGFDPRTVQPIASRYTDLATRPTRMLYKLI